MGKVRALTLRHGLTAFVLIAGLAGCSQGTKSGLQVSIRNHNDGPARIQLVEFDFVADEPGAAIGDALSLAAGASTKLELGIPATSDWALLINDIPGVTSLGLAEAQRGLPGPGPLAYTIDVDDGGLSTQVSRGGSNGGSSAEPAPN
jgi:hypothetical protein